MEYAIGIDLGTSNSLVAVYRNGDVEIIENEFGNRKTPSYVAFTENERLFGDAALNYCSDDPANTVYGVKRLMGRRFELDNDDKRSNARTTRSTSQTAQSSWPFKVGKDDMGMTNIQVKYLNTSMKFRPEEISAMILEKLKHTAESYLGEVVTKAVISVPAHFNDSQRQATIDAGRIAGLKVLAIINEPSAAALCYRSKNEQNGVAKNVLIFDLGGGSLDVSVVHIDGDQLTVKSSAGNCSLGGEDFDNFLVDKCVESFKEKNRHDIRSDKRAMQRLREECQRAKITLSSSKQTRIKVDYLYNQKHFSMPITRTDFETLCDFRLLSAIGTFRKTLSEAKLNKSEIDDIMLVGGSTRIPKLQDYLKVYFKNVELKSSFNGDLAVVSGAAIQASILNQDLDCPNYRLTEITSHRISVLINSGLIPVVSRNSLLPIQEKHPFETTYKNQQKIVFLVYEGEAKYSTGNNYIGEFCILDIPKTWWGKQKLICTFKVDTNGILSMSAITEDSSSELVTLANKQCNIPWACLSSMIANAIHHTTSDKEFRNKILAKNELESVLFEIKEKLGLIVSNEKVDRKLIDSTVVNAEQTIKNDNQKITKKHFIELRKDLMQEYNKFVEKCFTIKFTY